MDMPLPLTKDLVLIGGGHTHALVLRKWGMRPLAGARVTVINPGPTAPYTGMLPGYVAGHYGRDELDIDLVRLGRFAGARVILGAVAGIDRAAGLIHVPGRPPIAYDVASVNVGITSDLPSLPGFTDHAVAAKPLGPFAVRWDSYRHAVQSGASPPEIVVIGGGVGGVELSLSMAFALRNHTPRITVVEADQALPGLAEPARKALLAKMQVLGVALIEGSRPAEILSDHVVLDNGDTLPSTFTVGVAGARPHPWLAETGLDLNDGFIRVSESLQSSDPAIFAAGDCAALPDARPKAGVFAVREAPVLFDNLRAALSGSDQLRPYRPQKDYLKLISLGGKSAVADKWGGRAQGPWIWRWKDWIDQKFMRQFADLPVMTPTALPTQHASGLAEALGDKPMCGGCGAKVGGDALAAMRAALPTMTRKDVTPLPGDDAALLTTGSARQVLTTDHLRAVTEDPYTMAKIAAVHALGDIWAMGAVPQAALATVILPRLSDALQQRWLAEIMAGASEIFGDSGAEIVGGHTSIGSELTIGFSITGLVEGDPITLAGARPGDALILTKPIGSGTVLAAEMQSKARGEWVAATLAQMVTPQDQAAEILRKANAMTDVTGFGLAGHLMNICEASGVAAEIDLALVPVLDGAAELAAKGVRSTLYPSNRSVADRMSLPFDPKADLLFDPQTAGGLLAATPETSSEEVLAALRANDVPAVRIGRIEEGAPLIKVQ